MVLEVISALCLIFCFHVLRRYSHILLSVLPDISQPAHLNPLGTVGSLTDSKNEEVVALIMK